MTVVPPPPGWELRPVIPTSQQQAQDTVLGYLKKTLQGLPEGTTFDRSPYPGSSNVPCSDDTFDVPENQFYDMRQALFPPDTDLPTMMVLIEEIWSGWGWHVVERDEFRKPNRFGYGPDGYTLQIVAANPPGYPPTIIGSAPCFPGELARWDIPVPTVLTAD